MPSRSSRRPAARRGANGRTAKVFGLAALFSGGMAGLGPAAFAATPAIATSASGGAALGGSIVDHADVTGLAASAGAPALTFTLYGPTDPGCTGPAVFTDNHAISVGVTSAS